jgi:AcrR family transcriptional regulator
MARPVNANADETRQRLLDAASALFSEHGFDGASVREIARSASVSVATVHHYYGNKAGLYGACIEAMHEELVGLRDNLTRALADTHDAAGVLDAGAREGFRFAWAHRDAVRLIMRHVIDHGRMEAAHAQRWHWPFLDSAAALLEETLEPRPLDARLSVQSGINLVVRYALTAPDELIVWSKVSEDLERDAALQLALRQVEDHLARAICAIFGVTAPPRSASTQEPPS